MITIISFPMMMAAQSGGPLSGSGSIFGGPVVNYSTVLYHEEAIDLDSVERVGSKKLERQRRKSRRHRFKRRDRSLQLRFYNHTSMKASTFRREVEIQVAALERDYTVDSLTYVHVIGGEEPHTPDYQILRFTTLGNNYNPSGDRWEDWHTFGEPGGGPRDRVSVHVVEGLPEYLGHGYARYGWIDRPESADIIIRASSFGTGSGDFNQGKVLTHLLANYLGLLPLIGDGYCGGDLVDDTPIHNSVINFCIEGPPPISLCDSKPMLQHNFMAHSPDACKDSFTIGQWKRMLQTIQYITER